MKVVINGMVYDSHEQPIAIKLEACNKRQIANMLPESSVYAAFPEGSDLEEMKKLVAFTKELK